MTSIRAEGVAGPRQVSVYGDLEALSDAAARTFVEVALDSVRLRGSFAVALGGGTTPRRAYELLAERHVEEVPWARTEVFFGDERCVPPDDPRSNYAMAHDALLSRVPLEPSRVHPIPAFGHPPAVGAERYEAELRRHFRAPAGPGAPVAPTFDLAILGVGADGHTASLFPGDAALLERERWALAVEAPEGLAPRWRITLTLPVLKASRHVLILAAGEAKRRVLAEVLDGSGSTSPGRGPLPAAVVHGTSSTRWLLDAAAWPPGQAALDARGDRPQSFP